MPEKEGEVTSISLLSYLYYHSLLFMSTPNFRNTFFSEFKAFAMRGNVVDLAVAVVIGTAFGNITTSLVDNIITPLIGIFLGGISFSKLALTIGDTAITYGAFIQSIIDFTIIAFVIFVAIKVMNTLRDKQEKDPKNSPKPSQEVQLLTEIRDLLKRP